MFERILLLIDIFNRKSDLYQRQCKKATNMKSLYIKFDKIESYCIKNKERFSIWIYNHDKVNFMDYNNEELYKQLDKEDLESTEEEREIERESEIVNAFLHKYHCCESCIVYEEDYSILDEIYEEAKKLQRSLKFIDDDQLNCFILDLEKNFGL